MNNAKRIIIVTAKRIQTDSSSDLLRDTLNHSMADGPEICVFDIHDLVFSNEEDSDTIYDTVSGLALEACDLVVFRDVYGGRYRDLTGACATYLLRRGIPYVSSALAPNTASKYSAQVMRQAAGLPAIPSIYSTGELLPSLIANDRLPFKYPIVIKDATGRKGLLNFIAHDKETALEILRSHSQTRFIIQRYIENDGDYRIVIMGDQVVLVMLRRAAAGTHLNNTSQGAEAIIVENSSLDIRILDDALLAARVEKLEVAGVDIIIDKVTKQPYVMEVNAAPQLITGAFGEQKMTAYSEYLKRLLSKNTETN